MPCWAAGLLIYWLVFWCTDAAPMLNPVFISILHCFPPFIHLDNRFGGHEEALCLQVRELFPSARGLEMTWHSIVKIQQSLYREVRCRPQGA